MRDRAQVSEIRAGLTLILRFGFTRTCHLDPSISHAMIAINHIDNNLFNPALGDKVMCALKDPP